MEYSSLKFNPYSFLYENLNEGLIRSYNISDVTHYLNSELNKACVKHVSICERNPYFSKKKTYSKDEFVRVSLKTDFPTFFSYKTVIDKCYSLLGWFTGIIEVSIKTDNGYIPYAFFRGEPYRTKRSHDFVNCFFSEDIDCELDEFLLLHKNDIFSFVLIIEEKFPIREYAYDADETFFHQTESAKLSKILKQGLTPKSYFNFPSRIYLTNDIEEEMGLRKTGENVVLKVKLKHGQKLYHDLRSNSFFTYDNISPNEIEVIKK